jgi:filamentous hemagglutinin family protein
MRSTQKFSGLFGNRLRLAQTLACTVSFVAAAQSAAQTAPVLPSGGRVATGVAEIGHASGGAVTITQSSPTAIVNWTDFSIGTGGKVSFRNGQGATLNRVDGPGMSRIDGSLLATGSVYLVNPHGVIIGKNGIVQVGGSFVASTLDIADADFTRGGDRTFSGASTASVVNLGHVSALGGDVALIATAVANRGAMSAPNGTAALAAGSTVLMRDMALDGGRFTVLVGGSGTSASNSGAIDAAVIELRASGGSVYALAGNSTGVVRARTVTSEGGRIFLTAGDGGTVNVAGATLDASGRSGGTIDVSGGRVAVDTMSLLDGSGAGGRIQVVAGGALQFGGTAKVRNEDGIGGKVETSGATVDFTGASVDTSGLTAGQWLIDPVDLTIDARAASTIDNNLRTTNVTLQTTMTGSSGPDTSAPGSGDIVVAAPLTWSSANSLTLDAYRAIRVNADVTITGAGKLALNAASDESGVLLSFAPNRSVRFTAVGNAGRALTINGQSYTLIDSFAQFDAIDASGLGGFYALARPLDGGGRIYRQSLVAPDGNTVFSGTVEGMGNTIRNFSIAAPQTFNVGLFGSVSGTVRDLGLEGGSVTGGTNVGGLAGQLTAGAIVTNTSSQFRTVIGADPDYSVAGGLIGSADGASISASSARATVRASYATGGLIGGASNTQLREIAASGPVSGVNNVGGLVGFMSDSSLDGGLATGAASGISNGTSVGGLVGAIEYGSVTNSAASGNVSGGSLVGGLAGASVGAQFDDVSASGRVQGAGSSIGGLAGSFQYGDIENGRASGAVIGAASSDMVGGLVGAIVSSIVENSGATGRVTGDTQVGGLVGGSATSDYLNVDASGKVVAVGNSIGGLIGNSFFDAIDTARASGAVQGNAEVGGLIGYAYALERIDATATGSVSGRADVGQLIGYNEEFPSR